jgi:uncharacterized protein (TIGR02284 family)
VGDRIRRTFVLEMSRREGITGCEGEAMTMMHASAADVLNQLIAICQDGELGFDTAASAVMDQAIKTELSQYCQDRRACVRELETALGAMGEKPRISDSVAGAMCRGWMNLTSAVIDDNEHAILSACERGEDATVESYGEAMTLPLPSPLNGLIASQFESIKRVHDRVRSLRDSVNKN